MNARGKFAKAFALELVRFNTTVQNVVGRMTDDEAAIKARAIDFARANKKPIARRLTDATQFPGEDHPVSVFMAGSPGAGKTEAAKELLAELGDGGSKVLRIDPDELRCEFAEYTGANSWLFQGGVSILVEKILDFAIDQKQSFLLDGTLSSYEVAERNVERSLKKGRDVQVLYVYQEPQFAWEFVQARESREGRNIKPEHFVHQYFESRRVVESLKKKFGQQISVDLLYKSIGASGKRTYEGNVDQIASHLPEKYSPEQV
jgi:predicted ABC-type ATPase